MSTGNARCITCALSRDGRNIVTDFDGPDFASTDAITRRSLGRPGDMPSRADRNRARRDHHVNGFAWILSRAVADQRAPSRPRARR